MKRRRIRQEKALARANRRAVVQVALGGLPVLALFLILISLPPRMSPEQLAASVKAQAIYQRLPNSRAASAMLPHPADPPPAGTAPTASGSGTVEPGQRPKYLTVGFEQLSAFPFSVTHQMLNEKTSALSASSETLRQIPDEIKALNDKNVCVRGFMLPMKYEGRLTKEFLLLRNQSLCCYGVPPKITEWITVQMPGEGVKAIMDQPVAVCGTLHVGDVRQNGDLVGIYRLEGRDIKLPGEHQPK